MSGKSFMTEQILTLLAEAPPRLAALPADLTPAQFHTPPGLNEWSANDVLAHIRSCADVWGKCIITIIAEDTPTIRAINPTTWIKQTNYTELEFQSSLRSFATQRAELLAILQPLPDEGWLRKATVTGAGKKLERTVLFYAQWLARHERTHVKQIERLAHTVHG
jgi:DinB family protein